MSINRLKSLALLVRHKGELVSRSLQRGEIHVDKVSN